jgi:ATP-dependent Clp protease ATP-binding subunit ClpA
MLTGIIMLSLSAMLTGFFPQKAYQFANWWGIQHKSIDFRDYFGIIEKLKEGFAEMRGQEKPKIKLMKEACSWLAARHLGLGSGRGKVLIFNGPPGSGKTMAAHIISKALGLRLTSIEFSSIDINDPRSCVRQIFYEKPATFGQVGIEKERKEIVQLRNNPRVVLLIDELDKLNSRTSSGSGGVKDESLLNFLWSVMDYGMAKVSDQNLNLSETLIIGTTNSLENFSEVFKNRVTVIDFEKLSQEDYYGIILDGLIPVLEKFKARGINIRVDHNALKKVAKISQKGDKGTRFAKDQADHISAAVLNFSKDNPEVKFLWVTYDFEKEMFKVCKTTERKPHQPIKRIRRKHENPRRIAS